MFQLGNVSVDERFVRVGSKSFAVNKITSVDVRETTEPGSGGHIVFGAIAMICGVVAISNLLENGAPGMSLLGAVVSAGLAAVFWGKRFPTWTGELFLVTNAGEAAAYKTNEPDEIARLREAIENVVARS